MVVDYAAPTADMGRIHSARLSLSLIRRSLPPDDQTNEVEERVERQIWKSATLGRRPGLRSGHYHDTE